MRWVHSAEESVVGLEWGLHLRGACCEWGPWCPGVNRVTEVAPPSIPLYTFSPFVILLVLSVFLNLLILHSTQASPSQNNLLQLYQQRVIVHSCLWSPIAHSLLMLRQHRAGPISSKVRLEMSIHLCSPHPSTRQTILHIVAALCNGDDEGQLWEWFASYYDLDWSLK